MQYFLANPYFGRILGALLLDFTCLALAACVAWWTTAFALSPQEYLLLIAGIGFAAFVLLDFADGYDARVLGCGGRTTLAIFVAVGIGTAATLGAHLVFSFPEGSLEAGTRATAVFVLLLLLGRLGFRVVSGHRAFTERVLLVGNSELSQAIAEAVRQRRNMGTEIAGFLSDDPNDFGAWIGGYPVLGRVHHLEKLIDQERVGRIVVASKRRDEHFPAEVLLTARLRRIHVDSGVAFFERVTGRLFLRELRPSYLIFNDGFAMGAVSEVLKRAIDVTLAAVGLVVAAPIVGLAALAIRLDSRGPILFCQERLGKNGRVFCAWKMRTMIADAEFDGARWAEEDDSRATRVGRVLRKTHIDELPQLWNVLVGEMSLVGPRPERPEFYEMLCEKYPYFVVRGSVRPGITGWAQIRQGYVNDVEAMEEKLALDMYYLKYRSLAMDFLILWRTIKTVLLFRGQ